MTKMQIIGQAVIVQAVKDLKSKNHNCAEQANRYLSLKSKGFLRWCEILGVEPEWLLTKIRKECADDYKRLRSNIA